MKKNHTGLWVGCAVFLAAAAYSVILFILKSAFDSAAWVLYGTTLAAFLLLGLQTAASAKGGSTIILNSILNVVTWVFFLLQFVFGGIVCMFFDGLPLTPVVISEIVLVAAYLAAALAINAFQSKNRAQDKADENAVLKLRLMEDKVTAIMEEESRPEVKKALKELAEVIHYSDVVALPELRDTDSAIVQNIAMLQAEVTNKNGDPMARIDILRRLMSERDRTAAILKR